MWAKWIGHRVRPRRRWLACGGRRRCSRRRHRSGLGVTESRIGPDTSSVGFLLLLVPLLSPQGWDYVLLLATPAFVLPGRSVPRRGRWRGASSSAARFALTSFTIFDLSRAHGSI